MRNWSFARYASIALGVGLLAGCSAAGTQSSVGGGSVVPPAAHGQQLSKIIALTNPKHLVPQGSHRVGGHSWMKYGAKGGQLLYVSNDGTDTVDVYSYPAGTMVGQVTGLEYPTGLCSDKKGNVYVTDFESGVVSEIGAGGTTVVNTLSVTGESLGCSVSKKGDLAVSIFAGSQDGYGAVVIFKGAKGSGNVVEAPNDGYFWAPTYDKKGNIFVECNYGSSSGPCEGPTVVELKNGASSFTGLTVSGATIDFPAAAELVGKSIGLGDQEPNGEYALGIYSAKLSGTTLNVSQTTIDTDSNCNSYGEEDALQWANVSKKPNGLQTKKVTATVAGNLFCDPSPVNMWPFPKGGNATQIVAPTGSNYYGYGATLTD
jgi:hypothetical protein